MARFNAKLINNIQTTPETVQAGAYEGRITRLAVRCLKDKKTGEPTNERVFYSVLLDGEQQERRFQIPVQFSSANNPMGCDSRHIELFSELLSLTGAQLPSNEEEGPNVYGYTDDGEEVRLAIGSYELPKRSKKLRLGITRKGANDFQIREKICDRAHYVNDITEVSATK